jgi:hypothetical protein
MQEKDTDGLLPDREHYKELARQVREVARLARFPFARKELLRPAASFEYRARHLGRYELAGRAFRADLRNPPRSLCLCRCALASSEHRFGS